MIPKDVGDTRKNTGFSELPICVPYVFQRCSKSIPQLSHTSSIADAPLDQSFVVGIIDKTSQVSLSNRNSLAHSIFKKMMPRFIRLLRGAGYESIDVDNVVIIEIFNLWYESVRRNAELAGLDCETGLPCSDELVGRFADMWQTAFAKEHDWVTLVQNLIRQRSKYVTDGSGSYPETLRRLESDLVTRETGMYATDAAGVLVAWTIASTNPEGQFFLSERDAGQFVCKIAGKSFKDLKHARTIGRTMLRKLQRLDIIEIIEKGVAWNAESHVGKSTTFRWIWGGDHARVN